ncbi:restriction endonuclease subunit S [Novosphingobium sp.]|uniref:restriction endonuclease subunit S n=1 Tax=Novosphingobium sp. TaxID=1874826 RepID=UPI002FDE7B4B
MTLAQAGVALIDCVHATPAAMTAGLPYIAIPQMKDGRLDFDGARKISRADFIEWTRKARPQRHDIVLSRRTNPGVIAPVLDDTEFALGQNLVLLRADGQTVALSFLRWLASSPYWWDQIAKFNNVGAIFDSLRCADVPNFELPIPPISEQLRIADLLAALDDKIELNRRMNATLERQARALFRDWFVDFGPTRAKQTGAPAYLVPDLWNLFPATLDPEGKPEGWEERPLDTIAEFLNGLALQKFPAQPGMPSLPVIKIAELRSGITANSNRASLDVPQKYVIEDEDFLFSWSGSLLAKFWTEGRGALNQHLFKVSSAEFPAWFFSQWVWHHLEEFQSIAASKATTMGHIQRGHLSAAMTMCPPPGTLAALGQVMQPLQDRVLSNLLESRTLAQTRDLLLPKLMSGEIRVRDAEDVAGLSR